MMCQTPARAGRLNDGKLQKLLKRYRLAHAAFGAGDFKRALGLYDSLRAALHPHFVAIVRRNLGIDLAPDQDLSPDQVNAMVAGVAKETERRLRSGSPEGKTANLCSAMAHDVALVARHLAEGTDRGRDPEVAEAIIAGFAHAIAVAPHNPINYHNLGGYLDYLGRDAEACHQYRLALQLNQHQWESWVSWGHGCARLGDLESAEHCWSNALMIVDALERQDVEKLGGRQRRWAISMLRLLKGDYARGWDDYEARLSFAPYLDKHGRPDLTAPLWNDHQPIARSA